MKATVIIPFRDRGTDPLRLQNLMATMSWWDDFTLPRRHGRCRAVSDGRGGKELFNRSAAYNLGVAGSDPDTDILIFAESDMLVPHGQIEEAIALADKDIGMVVPFSTYCYHGPENSEMIRCAGVPPEDCKPKWVMANCTSIGAVNILSRATMDALGQWDEKFEGNWYDDDAMKLALEALTAPTRFVDGKGHHLYHLPGHRGKHLTDKEKMATRRNQTRLGLYEIAVRDNNAAEIRRLLKGER